MESPELQEKIKLWREKAAEGTLTLDEIKEALIVTRQGRISACFASKVSKEKKAKKVKKIEVTTEETEFKLKQLDLSL